LTYRGLRNSYLFQLVDFNPQLVKFDQLTFGVLTLISKTRLHFQVSSAYELPVPIVRQPYGVGEPRIIGGQPAAKGQFPYQAAIFLDGNNFCGGSLISKNWAMTAAHCVDPFQQWVVVFGAQDIRNTSEPGRVTIVSKQGITHEKYDGHIIINDIGLIYLPKDVVFSGKCILETHSLIFWHVLITLNHKA